MEYDIVMGRRRDQTHAGDGMSYARNDLIDLMPRKLPTFTGFRALRHLDL